MEIEQNPNQEKIGNGRICKKLTNKQKINKGKIERKEIYIFMNPEKSKDIWIIKMGFWQRETKR